MNFGMWLNKNKWMILVLVVVVGVWWWKNQPGPISPFSGESKTLGMPVAGGGGIVVDRGIMPIQQEAAPYITDNRLVVRETSLAMVVKDVRQTINEVENLAKSVEGYMVDSYLSQPEEAQTGSINVRVPSEKRAEVMESIRKMGVRVVTENVMGTDVTDQYVDIQGRLETLQKTKDKLEKLLDEAQTVTDTLNVQREINNLQAQIDSLKGQQKYLEQTAKLTKISVQLSTDELSLPYAPTEAWRPAVIFKLAVRSLVQTIRGVGTDAIWIVVYSPLWLPILGLLWWINRRKNG